MKKQVNIHRQALSFGITKEGNIITRKIGFLSDVLKLRRLLREINADIVIATEYPFAAAAILSGAKKRSAIYAWEHHHFYELRKNQFWSRIFQFTYPRLSGIICLNTDEEKIYRKFNQQVFVIPNFIEPAGSLKDETSKTILTIARLNPVKGMDQMVSIARPVFEKHPDWNWKLIGAGELEEKLKNDIHANKLEKNIIMVPPKDHNVMREYEQAALFVLLSRNECFPMTLLEAQSAGLPCIAFDCESGPRHIIKQDENGLLVEKGNAAKMTEAIISLIEDPSKRKMFGTHARENVLNFTPAKIFAAWQQVILKN